MGSIQESPVFYRYELPDQVLDQIWKALGFVYSNENMAIRVYKTTAAYTLTNRDSFIIGDPTGGTFGVTLAQANSWGSDKSALIMVKNIAGANNVTIAAATGDTLVGGGITLTPGQLAVLVSDSTTNWYRFA